MKIGLALGSGSSRGWSHVGVIKALADQGIVPDIVCGTSIGSLVGAAYLSNNLEKLEGWARSLTRLETAKFLEINASLNGFVNSERFHRFLDEYVASESAVMESFSGKYAAVATELETGREVWLTEGSVLRSVWSSMSMPGLFPAIKTNKKWLVDGALVNPVPVSVCRALGADVVIAVNLNGDIVGKHFHHPKNATRRRAGVVGKLTDLVTEYTASVFPATNDEDQAPSLFEALAGSINITQDRITRSRMAGDPPDILLAPKLSQIGLLEAYRANEAISEGRACVQRMLPEIEHVLSTA